MADTAVAPTNEAVAFRGEPKMPFQSNAQRGAMFAAAEGKSNLGIPQKVADKFIKDSGAQLPKRAKAKVDDLRRRGLVSDRQAARRGFNSSPRGVEDGENANQLTGD